MSVIRQSFKLLLGHSFYNSHCNKIPERSFDEIGQELLPTLKLAHGAFNRDLTADDVFHMHTAENPAMTTANKNTVQAYLSNVSDETDIKSDVAEVVFANLWRKEVGRHISEFGLGLADGDRNDPSELLSFMATIGADFLPKDFGDPVDTDPIALFNRLNQRGKWSINIPVLSQRIKHVSPGQFVVIMARPESGKTATIVNLMAGREGFAAQGANVHLLANEEGADITAGRAMCCYNQVSFHTARENPSILATDGWGNIKTKLTFLHKPEMTMQMLDQYLKQHKPDVLIIDQLDHVNVAGNYEKGYEKLGHVYRRARELASIHECLLIGVCQASADAEGKTRVTYAMAEGSKTAKAAAADLIIGIGKADDNGDEEGNVVLRHFTVSKNKISGWKGSIVCQLNQAESRLVV